MLSFLDYTLILRITKQICAEKESKIKILPMYGFVAQSYQYCLAQERGPQKRYASHQYRPTEDVMHVSCETAVTTR